MRFFDKPIIVEIPAEKISIAKEFAEAVVRTVNYSDSNQSIQKKIEDDHFISKLGEEAVYILFSRYTPNVSEPDYTIYVGDYKSWEPDLRINNHPLAVKTQKTSSSKKYGLSWTFQFSTKRSDPILSNPEYWVCFVECDDLNNYSCRVLPPFQIKNLPFKSPVLEHLKNKKKVIYFEDLKGLLPDT